MVAEKELIWASFGGTCQQFLCRSFCWKFSAVAGLCRKRQLSMISLRKDVVWNQTNRCKFDKILLITKIENLDDLEYIDKNASSFFAYTVVWASFNNSFQHCSYGEFLCDIRWRGWLWRQTAHRFNNHQCTLEQSNKHVRNYDILKSRSKLFLALSAGLDRFPFIKVKI